MEEMACDRAGVLSQGLFGGSLFTSLQFPAEFLGAQSVESLTLPHE